MQPRSFVTARTPRNLALAAALAVLAIGLPQHSAAQTIISDTEIEDMLRDFSDPILRAADLRPEDVRIHLIADREINAFVTGGQQIFFHTGLITESETPEELMGVIAHEVGHIAGAHLARRGEAASAAWAPTLLAIGLGVLAIAAGAPDAGAALIAGSQQFGFASLIAYNQTQESAADQAGATFLETAGISSEGLLKFFENFRYQEVLSNARRFQYFRTHPLSSDRIEALRDRVERSSYTGYRLNNDEQMRLDMAKAKIIGFLEPPSTTYGVYPESDQSLPARYARAVASYRAPDLRRALALTDALIAEQPENPYFLELKGQILFEFSQVTNSIAYHERAVELAPNKPLLMIALARSLAESPDRKDIPRAVELLEGAIRIEKDNAFAWGELAKAYDAMGRPGDARLATAEQAFAVGVSPRAFVFARRSLEHLEAGTPAWQRAQDIIALTQPRGGRRDDGPRQRIAPASPGN